MANITYRVAILDDLNTIRDFYDANIPGQEPLCTALGIKAGDFDWRIMVADIIPHGTSVLAFDGDVLIAVRTSSVETNNGVKKQYPSDSESLAAIQSCTPIFVLLDELDDICLPKLPQHINKYNKILLTNVRPDYLRRGIASKLKDMVETLSKEKGCQGVYTQATNMKSQSLYYKDNWTALGEILHKDHVGSDGLPVFKMPPELNTDRVIGMWKEY